MVGFFAALIGGAIGFFAGGLVGQSPQLAIIVAVIGLVFGATIGKKILVSLVGGMGQPKGFFGAVKAVFLFLVLFGLCAVGLVLFLGKT